MMEFDAVAFDIDGTLYSFDSIKRPYLFRTWYRVRSLRTFLRARQAMRLENFQSPEEMLAFQDEWVASRLNITREKARQRFERLMILDLAKSLSPKNQRFGLTDFLDQLVAANKKILLISDLPLGGKIDALALANYPWHAKIAADDVGVLKPGRAIFEAALDEAGCEPAKTIYVGDREDTDGQGAIGMGMPFIQMATQSRRTMDDFEKQPWPVFQDFKQVAAYLF